MKLPSIITHKNIDPILEAVSAEPYFQMGSKLPYQPADWFWQVVALEVPLGELCEDGMKTMALRGQDFVMTTALTGKEGFNAQGLEGKAVIYKPLFNALMNLRDFIKPGRGRISVLPTKKGS